MEEDAGVVAPPVRGPATSTGDGAAPRRIAAGGMIAARARDRDASGPAAATTFARFRAALRAPGGPLAEATPARGPCPAQWTLRRPPAGGRRSDARSRSRLIVSYFGIAGAGLAAGFMLNEQMSPAMPHLDASTAGLSSVAVVTAPLPEVASAASATSAEVAVPTPVALPTQLMPTATAEASAAPRAIGKGVVRRWRPAAAVAVVPAGWTGEASGNDTAGPDGRNASPTAAGARPAPAVAAASEMDRRIGHAFYELARGQERRGDAAAALQSYARAAALDPAHAATFYNWGVLLERSGDAGAAIDRYVRALRADPSHRFAWYNLGWMLQSSGDTTRAMRLYESALAAGAGLALTYYNLGYLEQMAGEHERAEQLYREAIARAPKHVLAHYNLGYVLQLRGDLKGAAARYRTVLALDPDHAWARRNLADLEALTREQDAR